MQVITTTGRRASWLSVQAPSAWTTAQTTSATMIQRIKRSAPGGVVAIAIPAW